MNARRVTAIWFRILAQFRRDRRTLALLFVIPLVILSLLYFLLRGSGGKPNVDLVNEDQGPVGSVIAQALQRGDKLSLHDTSLSTAQADVNAGRVDAYIHFPSDFSERALSAHVVQPEVRLEGSQPSASGTVVSALAQAMQAALSAAPGAAPFTVDVRVSYLHGGPGFDTLDYFGAAFIGLVVFFLVFVVTSVSFLRERSQGTLERLMASPLRRGEIVVGYMLGFATVAFVQSVEVILFSLYVLKIHNSGSVALIFLISLLMAMSAVNLGIFLSMFARTEFQAVQFIPLVIVPQVLLSGIVFPIETEPNWLQLISKVLPLTYAVSGLRDVMIKGADLGWASVQLDLGVVLGFTVLLVAAAAATLRRRVA
ncbi:MAG TPA: ABC transporter permease [Candidatus Dormibacteraeota bacterium]